MEVKGKINKKVVATMYDENGEEKFKAELEDGDLYIREISSNYCPGSMSLLIGLKDLKKLVVVLEALKED